MRHWLAKKQGQHTLDCEAEAVMQKIIGMANMDEEVAIRLCVEGMVAPRRERPVPLDLPRIESKAGDGDCA